MIRIKAVTTLPALLALSTSLMVACGGDDHDTARFATADDAHLRRALSAMSSRDAASLYLIGVLASGQSSTRCPGITTDGAVTTVSGGCTDADGDRIEGRIVITNVAPAFGENPAYDPRRPGTIAAESFTIDGPETAVAVDGTITVTNTGGDPDNGGTIAASLDVTDAGLAVHSELGFACDGTELCSFDGDAWIEVEGLGGATLSGTFRFDEPAAGSITATGADTLVLDVAASDDDCMRFRIDGGATRELCEPVEESAGSAARRAPRALETFAQRLR